MARRILNRRGFLRGLLAGGAVSVPLPVFEAALNINGDAFAGGEALPTRFGVWFWGNGVRPESFIGAKNHRFKVTEIPRRTNKPAPPPKPRKTLVIEGGRVQTQQLEKN